jgi:hypothetical protein
MRKIVNGLGLLARLDFKAVVRKLKHERKLADVARGS